MTAATPRFYLLLNDKGLNVELQKQFNFLWDHVDTQLITDFWDA
jgi:hypothetical protein